MSDKVEASTQIIAMEEAALERWGRGDPKGFLEISAPDVVYFDPFVDRRVDGRQALARLYEPVKGKVQFDRCEMLWPRVQPCGQAAVLTFNFVSYLGEATKRWNCTEVYRRRGHSWEIIQTHWSYTAAAK